MRNVAARYNITLYPLTDIHIGSGEDIEAYEYTVKNGYLYKFDMYSICDKMSSEERKIFINTIKEGNFIHIRSWIYKKYDEKWGYIYKEKVSDDFEDLYRNKVTDKVKQNEGNQLKIAKFIEEQNDKYIPGSSIKGALRTGFIFSKILNEEKKYEIKKIKNENQILEAKILKAEKKDKNGNLVNSKGEKLGIEPKIDPFKTLKIFDSEKIDSEQFSVIILKSKDNRSKGNGKNSSIPIPTEVLNGNYHLKKDIINSSKGIKFQISFSDYILRKSKEIVGNNMNTGIINYNEKEFNMDQLLIFIKNKYESIIEYEILKERKNDSNQIKVFYEDLKKFQNKIYGEYQNISLFRIGKYTGFNDKTINLATVTPDEKSRTVIDSNSCPMGWALIKVEEVKDE